MSIKPTSRQELGFDPRPRALDPEQNGALIDGRYALVREIGVGGMGVVYEATHVALQRRVAIKLLTVQAAANQRNHERFEREAQALARFTSPYIVAVTDYGYTREGIPFLVMEYLDGSDLRRVLARDRTLSIARTLSLVGDAIRGVQATHREGFVHRDLKPENLFVTRDDDGCEQCRLLDFGMVKLPNARTFTREGALVGTVGYMAPEQISGQAQLDLRADVYALGAIIYECLAGRPVFSEGRSEAVLLRTMRDQPPDVRHSNAKVPAELANIVTKALSHDPGERFQTARELGEALAGIRPYVTSEILRPAGGRADQHSATLPDVESPEELFDPQQSRRIPKRGSGSYARSNAVAEGPRAVSRKPPSTSTGLSAAKMLGTTGRHRATAALVAMSAVIIGAYYTLAQKSQPTAADPITPNLTAASVSTAVQSMSPTVPAGTPTPALAIASAETAASPTGEADAVTTGLRQPPPIIHGGAAPTQRDRATEPKFKHADAVPSAKRSGPRSGGALNETVSGANPLALEPNPYE